MGNKGKGVGMTRIEIATVVDETGTHQFSSEDILQVKLTASSEAYNELKNNLSCPNCAVKLDFVSGQTPYFRIHPLLQHDKACGYYSDISSRNSSTRIVGQESRRLTLAEMLQRAQEYKQEMKRALEKAANPGSSVGNTKSSKNVKTPRKNDKTEEVDLVATNVVAEPGQESTSDNTIAKRTTPRVARAIGQAELSQLGKIVHVGGVLTKVNLKESLSNTFAELEINFMIKSGNIRMYTEFFTDNPINILIIKGLQTALKQKLSPIISAFAIIQYDTDNNLEQVVVRPNQLFIEGQTPTVYLSKQGIFVAGDNSLA